MRELKTKDIFTMSKIVKKMGLKVKELEITETTTQMEAGVSFIVKIFESLHLAQEEVTVFFADLTEMTPEEFENLPIEKVFEFIKEFKNTAGLESFLKQAVQ